MKIISLICKRLYAIAFLFYFFVFIFHHVVCEYVLCCFSLFLLYYFFSLMPSFFFSFSFRLLFSLKKRNTCSDRAKTYIIEQLIPKNHAICATTITFSLHVENYTSKKLNYDYVMIIQ